MTKLTGIAHLGIPTNDISKTIEFYKKLGFEVLYETVNGEEKVAFLNLKNLMIETYENHNAVLKTGSIDHIAIDTSDIDASYNEAKAQGLYILEEIQFLPFWEHGVKFFKLKGPNEEVIEICQKLEEAI